jgi:hypothetical protein
MTDIDKIRRALELASDFHDKDSKMRAAINEALDVVPTLAQPAQLPDNWDRLSFELAGDIQHSGMGREEAAGRIRAFACDAMLTALGAQPPAAPVETRNGPADYADAGPGSVRTDQCADLNAPATSLPSSSAGNGGEK